jgi:hypothetical protein
LKNARRAKRLQLAFRQGCAALGTFSIWAHELDPDRGLLPLVTETFPGRCLIDQALSGDAQSPRRHRGDH